MLCFIKRIAENCVINACGCIRTFNPDPPDDIQGGVVNNSIQIVHNGVIVVNTGG